MTARRTSRTCTASLIAALGLLVTLAGCSSESAPHLMGERPPTSANATPGAEAAPSGTPQDVRLARLTSPALIYEPAPAGDKTPVLKKLIQGGWNLGASLDTEIKPLRARLKSWRRVKCYEVRFTSHQWQGKPVRIFGFYAVPAAARDKLAGLLLVHGGGGYATLDRVVEAAGKGYAALSIDLPGKGPLREEHSRSTGPDMSVTRIFTVKPALTDNYIYNAVLAQMRSVSFLRGRPEVDPGRIGLVGVSWGGATGLIATSLDTRIACFVNMFGSGYLRGGSTWHDYLEKLPAAEFDAWESNFDASRYVSDISVPVLALTGTNDNCYYLPRFMRTARAIRPAPDLLLRANLDHKIDDAARTAYFKWLAVHLKGAHNGGHPSLKGFQMQATQDGVRAAVRGGGKVAVARAEVCYGETGGMGWTDREWKTVRCTPDASKTWWAGEFKLPSQVTYVFGTVYFADGSALSTPVHSVGRVVINRNPVVTDVPFMRPGELFVEARTLAHAIQGEAQPTTDGIGVSITRGSKAAQCEAEEYDGLYFVNLRDACEGLGAIVHFHNGQTIVSLSRK